MEIKTIQQDKKIFFASDFHLYTGQISNKREGNCPMHQREAKLCTWLHRIMPQTQALFLLGDIFDFWFEYKYLIPKIAPSFQAKLLEFLEANIPIYYFLGNHDCWAIDYFTGIGIEVHKQNASIQICNKKFLVGHGDLLDYRSWQKIVSKLYRSSFCHTMARMLPPDVLYGIFNSFFKKKNCAPHTTMVNNDPLFDYCRYKIEPVNHHDFYIFGHMHNPCIKPIGAISTYCNLGDWISHNTYAYFDGIKLALCKAGTES